MVFNNWITSVPYLDFDHYLGFYSNVLAYLQDPGVRCLGPNAANRVKIGFSQNSSGKSKLRSGASSVLTQSLRSEKSSGVCVDFASGRSGKERRQFLPKNLTFNFCGRSHRKRINPVANERPFTCSSELEFSEFVDLFEAFIIRSRNDLKDIFQKLVSCPTEDGTALDPVNLNKRERLDNTLGLYFQPGTITGTTDECRNCQAKQLEEI